MKTHLKPIVVGMLVPLIGACGGSGSDTGSASPTPLTPPSFADLSTQEDALRNATGSLAVVDPGTLPTTGGAAYDGTLGFLLDEGGADEVQFLGELEISADFDSSTIDGSASNFVDSDETLYTGALDLENGFIDRTADPASEFTFDALLDGTLVNPAGDQFASVASIEGEFLGAAPTDPDSYVAGVVKGAFDKNGTTLLIEDEGMTPVDNVFYAEN